MDIYIYYTVAESDVAAARQRVTALQVRLASEYDIAAQLKRRSEQQGRSQTWMEIYPNVPINFAQVIEHAAAEEGITALIQGTRQVECFADLPPCA